MYRAFLVASAFISSEAFIHQSYHGRLLDTKRVFSNSNSADSNTDDTTDVEELPFLALPGAGGSSFDPLKSENRFAPLAEGKDLQEAKFVSEKFELQYTCKICETRNKNQVSRIAYRNGVVIVVCKGCQAKHLIADNLGWHNYIGGFEGEPDIEAYLASQGRADEVNRVNSDVFELEKLLADTPTLQSNSPSEPDTSEDGKDSEDIRDMQ